MDFDFDLKHDFLFQIEIEMQDRDSFRSLSIQPLLDFQSKHPLMGSAGLTGPTGARRGPRES
jgi:hypothetical protein